MLNGTWPQICQSPQFSNLPNFSPSKISLYIYISTVGEPTSNEGVEEEGEIGGQPLHEEGEQDNERTEEAKIHEEPQYEEVIAPIPCTEISSDFNSKDINMQ